MNTIRSIIATALLIGMASCAPMAYAAGPQITAFDSSVEMRLVHNEGDFSRIGRTNGDVPRYINQNTMTFQWGRFTLDESFNVVIGQKWNVVNGAGNGMAAMLNPDVYLGHLTPHHYNDLVLHWRKGARWSVALNTRTSVFDNQVADHFGIRLTRNWME